MKKINFAIVAAALCLVGSSAMANVGFFDDFITVSANTVNQQYTLVDDSGATGDFNGADFGTVWALSFTSADMKTWNESQDTSWFGFYYEVTDASDVVVKTATEYGLTLGAPTGNNYQGTWAETSDILANWNEGVTPVEGATYKVGVWAKAYGATDGDQYMKNGDDNFVANFAYTAVPEPTSMALLGFGMLAIGLVRRRRNK